MPDLADLLEPRHTAVLTQECQKGVLGDHAVFPQLAEAARAFAIPNMVRLVSAARASSIPVVHCIAARRADGLGYNTNARIFFAARKSGVSLDRASPATEVIDEISVADTDITCLRMHGIGPFWGTELDPILRNLGVRTVVPIGVSVNIGITNLVMDAVNASYRVVLPRDAVCGIPQDYADAVIDNTLSFLATLTTTDEVLDVWR
jgi:nicotinamidase-related amidase